MTDIWDSWKQQAGTEWVRKTLCSYYWLNTPTRFEFGKRPRYRWCFTSYAPFGLLHCHNRYVRTNIQTKFKKKNKKKQSSSGSIVATRQEPRPLSWVGVSSLREMNLVWVSVVGLTRRCCLAQVVHCSRSGPVAVSLGRKRDSCPRGRLVSSCICVLPKMTTPTAWIRLFQKRIEETRGFLKIISMLEFKT